jgi:deazaflavin-dependent oxidoreductase (nitroreductase family)
MDEDAPMAETETKTEGGWDTDAANNWEAQLIADMRSHGGRPSGGPLAGQALILLYTTGARTGQRRRSILTSSRDGDAWVVAGTANGAPKHPGWLFNVEADPDVTVEADNEEFQATATVEREGPERDRLWANHVRQLPWFGEYPKQVGERTIPMVRLTRKA